MSAKLAAEPTANAIARRERRLPVAPCGDEEPSEERRLAARIANAAADGPRLQALLAELPPWQRATAWIVAVRTLGADRGRQACEGAFGRLPSLLRARTAAPAAAQPVSDEAVRWDVARASHVAERVVALLASEAPANDLIDLVSAIEPHLVWSAAALLRRTRLPDGASALDRLDRATSRAWQPPRTAFAARDEATAIVPEETARHALSSLSDAAGDALPAPLAERIGRLLGHDFTGVRVRRDGEAAAVARRLGVRAFTVGRTICFADGEWAPDDERGARLLLHELTHVVQHDRGRLPPAAGRRALALPNDPAEREARGAEGLAEVRSLARLGVDGPAAPLPHLDAIQRSFGHHDVSGIRAHLDAAAGDATRALGAAAYAHGEDVAFGQVSLRLSAHEAAHVLEQRAGATVADGVGREGDAHEGRADEVAARVERGESAEPLLDAWLGPPTASAPRAPSLQLARVVQMFGADYVLIDVPGDGSCLLHAVNLGLDAIEHEVVEQLTEEGVPLSADEIEHEVLLHFRAENDAETDREAFDKTSLALRHSVVGGWRQALYENEEDVINGLRADVQAIVDRTMANAGLLGKPADDHPMDGTGGKEDASKSSPPKGKVGQLSDVEFVLRALFEPEYFDGQRVPGKQAPPPLPLDQVAKTHGAMGVHPGGALERAIGQFIARIALGLGLGGGVPPGSLPSPAANAIPNELVSLYVDEFETNLHLWAGEAAVQMAAQEKMRQTTVHLFGEDEETGEVEHLPAADHDYFEEGADPQLHIYNGGSQTHFQLLLGPFQPGQLAGGQTEEEERDEEDDGFDEREEAPLIDDEREDPALLSADPNGFAQASPVLDEQALGEPSPSSGPRLDLSPRLVAPEWTKLREVAERVGTTVEDPAFFPNLYRACAGFGLSLADTAAAKLAEALLEWSRGNRQRVQMSRSLKQTTDPRQGMEIVPLAGIVDELVANGLPLDEVDRLIEAAHAYIAFSRKHSSWKASQAQPRVDALRQIAQLVNYWAETYDMPHIARAPSVAEFSSQSFSGGTMEVGETMRAVLTIDPGELVGAEPEESQAWKRFSDMLSGFVRAHLLNKHLGGPGESDNLGFLSDADNKKMSNLVEENLKRQVLEDNKRFFYKVHMPVGRKELQGAPYHLDPAIARLMAARVDLKADEIEPLLVDDEPAYTHVDPFAQHKMPADVTRSPQGTLSFPATPPDPRTLSKVQIRSKNRIASMEGRATSGRIDSMFSDPPTVREAMARTQRALLQATPDQRERLLAAAQSELQSLGVDPSVLEVRMRELAQMGRDRGTVDNAKQAQAQKADQRHDKRIGKLAARRVDVASIKAHDLKRLREAGEQRFKHVLEVLDAGGTLREAIDLAFGKKFKEQFKQWKEAHRR